MRRKPLAVVLMLAALGLMGIFASASFGSTEVVEAYGPVTYTDLVFGEVTCSGVHEVNAAQFPGTASTGGRDKFACHAPRGVATQLLGVTPGQSMTCYCSVEGQAQNPFYYWFSDDPAMSGAAAIKVQGKVSANGHRYNAVAWYAGPTKKL